jgi:dolichol-phosphate mannosyltransferase
VKLSVIIPVYNEHRTIEAVLNKVQSVEIPVEREIIVVDGNSIDGTKDILKKYEDMENYTIVFEKRPRGRGAALIEGLHHATGDLVIFQDADLELDPADYPDLLRPLLEEGTDVVFGSRFLAGKPRMTFLQYWGNRTINTAVNLLYGTKLTDVETCYQVFRRTIIRDFKLENLDFAFTVELTVKLIQAGHRIVEIPITYVPRGRTEGKKIYWADGFLSLWTLIKYRFRK